MRLAIDTENCLYFVLKIASPSEAGGWVGLQPLNNLLKLVDFVGEKALKAKVVVMEDSNLCIFEEATRHYEKMQYF